MKTFYLPSGQVDQHTCTIEELVQALQKYPPDTPVLATWEGVKVGIIPESLGTEQYSSNNRDKPIDVLFIDVNYY